MTPHPPMTPHEPGQCRWLLHWDHYCTKRLRHRGPHTCPCGLTVEKS